MSNIYEDLKALASEHRQFPAFRFNRGEPGKVTTAFLSLYEEAGAPPGFARLVIQDTPDPNDSHQFLVELERLRVLVNEPQPPLGER